LKNVELGDQIWPDPLNGFPHLLINNVSDEQQSDFLRANFSVAICEMYVGDEIDELCKGVGK
jgi:hypothetical protein